MTKELQAILDMDRPTRIREMIADLEQTELDVFRLMLKDLSGGCVERQLPRLQAVFTELNAIAIEDLNRRCVVAHDEVAAIEKLFES